MQTDIANRYGKQAEILAKNPSITISYKNSLKRKLYQLQDGSKLAYQEYGQADGFPLFYFHSTGSSRLECEFFSRSASRLGFRLIAVDRPGIGYSDFKSQLHVEDFAGNLLELATGLGLDRFGLMSFSTGGIFALATSIKAPERVAFHLSLSGIPGNLLQESTRRSTSYTAHLVRSLLPSCIRLFTRLRHALTLSDPGEYLERLQDILCYTDRKVLTDPKFMQILESSLAESLRQGIDGVAQDTGICFTDPGFALEDIQVPVYIWQGSADNLSSPALGEYLAAHIPQACFHSVAHRGHFFFIHCMDEIFSRVKFHTVNLQHAAA